MSKKTSKSVVVTSNPSKKLRLAFIGVGGIAGVHMASLVKFKDVEIVGLADPKPDKMLEHAKTYNIATENCFASPAEMLKKIKPDAVSVCSSNGAHEPNTLLALQHGADVIVEKPMAMNARQAQNMINAAKKANRKLVIGFQYRYAHKTQFLRKAVEAGDLGDILAVRCQALRRRGIPNWGVFGQKALQGGGPMIDIGVHCLEMAHYVMGSPKPVAASGSVYTYMGNKKSNTLCPWPNWDHKTYTVEDLAMGQIRFDNGAILQIEASFVAHIPKDVWNFEIKGTKGGGTYDPPTIAKDENDFMVNTVPAFIPSDGFNDHFDFKLRNFVDHVLYNKPSMAPAEHGLMVQKMLDGIYESSLQKKEIRIS